MKKSSKSHTVLAIAVTCVMFFAHTPAQAANDIGLRHRVDQLELLSSEFSQKFAWVAPPTQPLNITVDCSAGDRLNEAIENGANWLGPVIITISGVCTENIYIDRDNVSLIGATVNSGIHAPNTGGVSLTLTGRHINITGISATSISGDTAFLATDGASFKANNFKVYGSIIVELNATGKFNELSVANSSSAGVYADKNGAVILNHSVIDNSARFGVSASRGGNISLSNGSVVKNTGWHGAFVDTGGSLVVDSSTIESSAQSGIFIQLGGHVEVINGSAIQTSNGVHVRGGTFLLRNSTVANNVGNGISISAGGSINIQDGGVVESNTGFGIAVGGASSAYFELGSIVQQNTLDGIRIDDTSVAQFDIGDDGTKILGNGGIAVVCGDSPAVAQIVGAPETISGNGADVIQCP